MKIISWNVNGIRAVCKKGFVDFVKSQDADIYCIQETKAQKEQIKNELDGLEEFEKFWFSAQKKGYSGTLILSKKTPINVSYGIEIEEFDIEGRSLIVEYDDFYLINCYFPNSQHELKRLDYKIRFDEAILAKANELRKKKDVIITGDFNVAHKEIDLKNPKANVNNPGFYIDERDWFSKLIENRYVDTFRYFCKDAEQYTWWSYRFSARSKNIGWRLDYFVVNQEMMSKVKKSIILKEVMGSDHAPILIEF
jgi:exodeoxyribonuclease-3